MSTNNKMQDKEISITDSGGYVDITVPPAMVEEFKQLVRRSINTWQNMSPNMRRFADKLLGEGEIMQATYSSNSSRICLGCSGVEDNHSSFCPYFDKS